MGHHDDLWDYPKDCEGKPCIVVYPLEYICIIIILILMALCKARRKRFVPNFTDEDFEDLDLLHPPPITNKQKWLKYQWYKWYLRQKTTKTDEEQV